MAYGKKRLPPVVLEQMRENRQDKVVHRTEVKMLKAMDPVTPIGAAALLAATETAMTNPIDPVCNKCGQKKTDVVLVLTGTCELCHTLSLSA